jgi:glyoxylase I family protein
MPSLAGQNADMDLPAMDGFGHVDLTVSDVNRSVRWWEDVLGFRLIHTRTRPDFTLCTVLHESGFFIGLMEHSNGSRAKFDERAPGLDHLALRVPDRASLEAWAERLDDLGVEHSGVQDESAGPLIVFRDPDNIQLELWVFERERVDPDHVIFGTNS